MARSRMPSDTPPSHLFTNIFPSVADPYRAAPKMPITPYTSTATPMTTIYTAAEVREIPLLPRGISFKIGISTGCCKTPHTTCAQSRRADSTQLKIAKAESLAGISPDERLVYYQPVCRMQIPEQQKPRVDHQMPALAHGQHFMSMPSARFGHHRPTLSMQVNVRNPAVRWGSLERSCN